MSKVPSDAKLVFDGIRIKVYQWEQEQFDGSFKTFEVSVARPGVELIIVTPEGKIILSEEEQPYVGKFINLPGGCIEDGEEPLETAKKELLEEFGMESPNISLFEKIERGNSYVFNTYIYIVRDYRIVSKPNFEPGEKICPLVVEFDEFIQILREREFRDKEFQRKVLMMNKQQIKEMKENIYGICQLQY